MHFGKEYWTIDLRGGDRAKRSQQRQECERLMRKDRFDALRNAQFATKEEAEARYAKLAPAVREHMAVTPAMPLFF